MKKRGAHRRAARASGPASMIPVEGGVLCSDYPKRDPFGGSPREASGPSRRKSSTVRGAFGEI